MNRAIYFLAYTIPGAVFLSLNSHGIFSYFAIGYAFGILPLLEFILPSPTANLKPEVASARNQDWAFDFLLYSMVPIQGFLALWFCQQFGQQLNQQLHSADSGVPIDWFTCIGWVVSMGVACGVIGINVAHELGHRRGSGRARFERILSRLLLATSLNWQFYIEHNRGHHKNVSTPSDPESARFNEPLYVFFIRAIRDSFRNAWKLDRGEMILGLIFEFALLAGIFSVFGWETLLGFCGAALFGILLLQSVNYIEHYGLSRAETSPGVYETVKPHHSWNANPVLSRAILFELSRHSDHHAFSTRKYQILRHHDQAPQMPTGYPGMILLALVPPLWFRVMNPRVR